MYTSYALTSIRFVSRKREYDVVKHWSILRIELHALFPEIVEEQRNICCLAFRKFLSSSDKIAYSIFILT